MWRVLGSGMPEWTVAQVLAVHLRMHQAEGELFRTVLVRAGERADLQVTACASANCGSKGAKTLPPKVAELQQADHRLARLRPAWSRDPEGRGPRCGVAALRAVPRS